MNRRDLFKLLFAAPLAALVKPMLPKPAFKPGWRWVVNPEWENAEYGIDWQFCPAVLTGKWEWRGAETRAKFEPLSESVPPYLPAELKNSKPAECCTIVSPQRVDVDEISGVPTGADPNGPDTKNTLTRSEN